MPKTTAHNSYEFIGESQKKVDIIQKVMPKTASALSMLGNIEFSKDEIRYQHRIDGWQDEARQEHIVNDIVNWFSLTLNGPLNQVAEQAQQLFESDLNGYPIEEDLQSTQSFKALIRAQNKQLKELRAQILELKQAPDNRLDYLMRIDSKESANEIDNIGERVIQNLIHMKANHHVRSWEREWCLATYPLSLRAMRNRMTTRDKSFVERLSSRVQTLISEYNQLDVLTKNNQETLEKYASQIGRLVDVVSMFKRKYEGLIEKQNISKLNKVSAAFNTALERFPSMQHYFDHTRFDEGGLRDVVIADPENPVLELVWIMTYQDVQGIRTYYHNTNSRLDFLLYMESCLDGVDLNDHEHLLSLVFRFAGHEGMLKVGDEELLRSFDEFFGKTLASFPDSVMTNPNAYLEVDRMFVQKGFWLRATHKIKDQLLYFVKAMNAYADDALKIDVTRLEYLMCLPAYQEDTRKEFLALIARIDQTWEALKIEHPNLYDLLSMSQFMRRFRELMEGISGPAENNDEPNLLRPPANYVHGSTGKYGNDDKFVISDSEIMNNFSGKMIIKPVPERKGWSIAALNTGGKPVAFTQNYFSSEHQASISTRHDDNRYGHGLQLPEAGKGAWIFLKDGTNYAGEKVSEEGYVRLGLRGLSHGVFKLPPLMGEPLELDFTELSWENTDDVGTVNDVLGEKALVHLKNMEDNKPLVKGYVKVSPCHDESGTLTHWDIGFNNLGETGYVGTCAFSESSGKNAGYGLESMGVPEMGAAAVQKIIAGEDYGVCADTGSSLRLGVRGLYSQDIKLPAEDSITLVIPDDFDPSTTKTSPDFFNQKVITEKMSEKVGRVSHYLRGKCIDQRLVSKTYKGDEARARSTFNPPILSWKGKEKNLVLNVENSLPESDEHGPLELKWEIRVDDKVVRRSSLREGSSIPGHALLSSSAKNVTLIFPGTGWVYDLSELDLLSLPDLNHDDFRGFKETMNFRSDLRPKRIAE